MMSIIFEYEKPLEFVAVSLTLSQTELLFLSTGTDTTCAHIRLICGLWYVPPNVSLISFSIKPVFIQVFSVRFTRNLLQLNKHWDGLLEVVVVGSLTNTIICKHQFL